MSAAKRAININSPNWLAAGKPREGSVASAMRSAKAGYKLYLKHKQLEEHSHFTNDLHEALIQKDFQSFWKSCSAKLAPKGSSSKVIDGVYGSDGIAKHFCDVFSSTVQPNSLSANVRLHQVFSQTYFNYNGDCFDCECINVELVDKMIRGLKRGNAAGLDGLMAEHLIFSHPIVCVLLSLLFRFMVVYRFVPDDFGAGLVIPLLKSGNLDSTVSDNYRAITVGPCVSKVFEMCLMDCFQDWLVVDELQFGFHKGRGCRDAILTLQCVIKSINSQGSTATLCALDISKAFDKMSHYGLYIKLMELNIPRCFIDVGMVLEW